MRDLERKSIKSLTPPAVGSASERVKKQYGIDNPAQLCYNENQFGVSPKAVEAMRREAESMAFYPEPSSEKLRAALAKRYGVENDEIILSNGMDNVINMICHAYLNEGDEMLTMAPTFGAYPFGAALTGAKFTALPLNNNAFDLVALKKAISDNTKLVAICNPNNPTGTLIRRAELKKFMCGLPEHVVVVLDEAYSEFVGDEDYGTGLEYVKAGANVIVGRTFSKIYGLAGCRVGYAIAKKPLMAPIRKVAETFPVNRMAQVAALAAMGDVEFLNYVKAETDKGRDYIFKRMDAMNIKHTESAGNFIWADIGRESVAVAKELEKGGVIVRGGWGKGYESYLRISIGTMEQNVLLMNLLEKALI